MIGLGEMGGVFSRALLRSGHPVYPAVRGTDLSDLARQVPDPSLVLITVGESDLQPVLEALPEPWRGATGMLQNELLPRDWTPHGITDPTVAVVWFEKKPGQDVAGLE